VVSPGSATIDGYTSTLTTLAVTVAAAGGTPGYTYATTFTSGGSGISILNGTTATPSFQSTGLAEGDVKSGTARIRVSDSAAATYDVFVAVTITRNYSVIVKDDTFYAFGGSMAPAITGYVLAIDGVVHTSPTSPTNGSYAWIDPSVNTA